jgi:Zn ribbon nucleic-acid-binding protein
MKCPKCSKDMYVGMILPYVGCVDCGYIILKTDADKMFYDKVEELV